jgi:holo-[acyl-carrier protein] synthase
VVVAVGVDLVEMDRVARVLERWGPRFIAKIMGPEEAAGLPRDGTRNEAIACAIAAKEAASKCIGTGWSRGVRWRDVVVELAPSPRVRLLARASHFARLRGSSGNTRTFLERRGNLVVGQVFLLS